MVDPRKVPRTSYDSQATASDASIDKHEKLERYRDGSNSPDGPSLYPPKRTSSRYDAETYELEGSQDVVLDDDEEVGLMQADRDARTRRRRLPIWARLGSRGLKSRKKRPSVFAGCLIFSGVVLGFMLALPLLQWLSSNTPTSAPAPAPTSVYDSVSGVVNDVYNPFHEEDPSNVSSIWKQPASPDTADGHYALSNSSIFQVDFQDSGWDTFAKAAAGTGLPLKEVETKRQLMPLDMDIIFGGTLTPQTSDLEWSEEDPDEGVFSHVDWGKRNIYLEDVTHARKEKTGEGKIASFGGKSLIVEGANVKDGDGRRLDWTLYKFSPDVRWVLFYTSVTPQWRYSKKSRVWLHNIAQKKTIPIGSAKSKISYAAFAPSKAGAASKDPPSVVYVEDSNLFVIPRAGEKAIQVTTDGSATVFNAVPDWVYEEEVYGSDSVLWFSPGGSKLVYLRLDETEVPVYEIPKYNPDAYRAGLTTPYQKMTRMKYPKPGFPNPTVSVRMIDLDEIKDATKQGASVKPTQYTLHSPMSTKGKAVDEVDKLLSSDAGVKERLVTEVKWVSDAELLVKETDRYSDVMRLVKFDLKDKAVGADKVGEVVRKQDARADKSGWIRAAQTIEPLSHHNLSVDSTAYLDIVVSPEGYRHLAFYPSAASDKPIFLTQGKWEIAELKHVDAKRGRAYFTAARPTPALRNVYYVELPDWKASSSAASYKPKDPVALTDVSTPGTYDVTFDPKGAYYILYYLGPNVPYQKILSIDDPSFTLVLEENTLLRQLSSQYVKPSNTFYQLALNSTLPDGTPTVASVKEIRPHDFDPSGSTKYPVLMRVYGGPDSQLVDSKWNRADWHQYVSSTLGYIVIVVDGRGTGFKGQSYRSCVAGNLGTLEATDVNEAARQISHLPYVDDTKIGLWGWSYGGYLTAKTVELSKNLFSLAISVAPVTNWGFYDSIYTERYLKSPLTNKAGYETSSIHVTPAFSSTKYLLMHGSADDNVHFSSSAHLLDMLTKAKARGFRFRMFTDSRHSMSVRGAYRELFEEMNSFLHEVWGDGGKRGKVGKDRPSLHNSVE
ncbi:Peptidase S9B, dipeptidylpeptidase IV N-terminal [Kalmanozyma brasiliensis GHG001]|uniref:Peptidase S9B, dipeptidylpeptidase IV N-terminal n=1 Tax=Kalmanozyma brasiliensis (strain GHG001) TaxID=1365824 RepID=UPI0028680885|nr:Peptidase S9B, dipeptidylpeptidase IV N-terminal [Kalmanozyma brasiliensis GHG001]KAF6767213.1 Peptidase S9B, dipeptidylpeptidase IV N-terminal [Kalmanozyma brasiliensis GHG001]